MQVSTADSVFMATSTARECRHERVGEEWERVGERERVGEWESGSEGGTEGRKDGRTDKW